MRFVFMTQYLSISTFSPMAAGQKEPFIHNLSGMSPQGRYIPFAGVHHDNILVRLTETVLAYAVYWRIAVR